MACIEKATAIKTAANEFTNPALYLMYVCWAHCLLAGTGTGAVRAAVRAATTAAASRYMRSRLWRWVVVLFCQCC
jgi:hypothetical protein